MEKERENEMETNSSNDSKIMATGAEKVSVDWNSISFKNAIQHFGSDQFTSVPLDKIPPFHQILISESMTELLFQVLDAVKGIKK